MTDEEMSATEAEALLEYSKTQKRIACLRKRIEPFAEGMKELGGMLSRQAESIDASVDEKNVRFRWREQRYRGSPDSNPETKFEFDPVDLVQHLQDLQRETTQLDRLKKSLNQMGHGHILRD